MVDFKHLKTHSIQRSRMALLRKQQRLLLFRKLLFQLPQRQLLQQSLRLPLTFQRQLLRRKSMRQQPPQLWRWKSWAQKTQSSPTFPRLTLSTRTRLRRAPSRWSRTKMNLKNNSYTGEGWYRACSGRNWEPEPGLEFNVEAAKLIQWSSDHSPVVFRVRCPFGRQPETPCRSRHQDCWLCFSHWGEKYFEEEKTVLAFASCRRF